MDKQLAIPLSYGASMGVIAVTVALYFSSAFIYKINPCIKPESANIIWAAMNVAPLWAGIIMLTGILSAGISSASTFLSLIGSTIANDIFPHGGNLFVSRLVMFIAGFVVLVLAFFNPPQIFWVMYFGGTVIASSWGLPALASVWFRDMSGSGAFWGMLLGFLGCVIPKAYSALAGVNFPLWLDPFFVGLALSLAGIILGSKFNPALETEKSRYDVLHIRPDSEKSPAKDKITFRLAYVYGVFGIMLGTFFVMFYAVPYMRALSVG